MLTVRSRTPLALTVLLVGCSAAAEPKLDCGLATGPQERIRTYQDDVNRIIKAAQTIGRHAAYRGLDDFVDRFGARPSGSKELEDAIDFMEQTAKQDGFDVHTEEVMVPHWVRGEETLMMLRPRRKSMSLLGLGSTIGTQGYPGGVLKAEVVVFDNFTQMEEAGKERITGKIVVFNAKFGEPGPDKLARYAESNAYRTKSASKASALGAAAMLVVSRTDFSLYTPHTGQQSYAEGSRPIPAAAITMEDARIIARHVKKGKPVELLLKMSAANLPEVKSRNLIVDYGPADSTELVLLSAHMDSWDVGEGANDDGGGVFVNYHSLLLLKRLGLVPRRRIRAVFWTAEEEGLIGGADYVAKHEFDVENMQFAIDNDMGTAKPYGLVTKSAADSETTCFVSHVTSLLSAVNATRGDGGGRLPPSSETSLFNKRGVPTAALDTEQERYFWYHHTEADTMDALDADEMDLCVAVMAASAYVIADVEDRVPSGVPRPIVAEKNVYYTVETTERSSAAPPPPPLALPAMLTVSALLWSGVLQ